MLAYIDFPKWIKPEIIPGLPIRWYGLMYLIAFVITYLLFKWQVKNRKLDATSDDVMSFFFWGIIGLLIGARLFATMLFDPTLTYLKKPWLIFWPFAGGRFTGLVGMNYYGGLVGTVVACYIYTRVKKINYLDWGDMLIAGTPLGYTFGRLGNFINGELFGRVTKSPLGVVFPHARRFPVTDEWVQDIAGEIGMTLPESGVVNLPRHPTQLYEGFFEGIVLWLVVWFIFRPRKKYPGQLVGIYIIGYGLIRFVVDYFRMPISRDDFLIRLSTTDLPVHLMQTPLNLIPSQIYSLIMILGGVVFLAVTKRISERKESRAAETEQKKISSRKLRKKIR